MLEFDIFVPLFKADGRRVSARSRNALKKLLVRRFGGLTCFPQSNEGLWKLGKSVFRDKIVIFRVIAKPNASTMKFFSSLKRQLQREWEQKDVLIISRSIKML